jgi:hypothetical protein
MEDLGIFYGRLAYYMAIWYISPRFGTFYLFWYVVQRKIWQPCKESDIEA